MTTPQKTAAAFVLQATPWVPLVVRRGSSADVSVKIPLDDDEDDEDSAEREATNGHQRAQPKGQGPSASVDRARCVVWQFRIEEYDVAFQIAENGRAVHELARYAAKGSLPSESATLRNDGSDTEAAAKTTPSAAEPVSYSATIQEAASAEGVIAAATPGSVYTFRWDNSYSIVRHKRVFYRFVVTSARALRAAQTAADEMQQRHAQPKPEPTQVKPHLAKKLALERRLTVDEVSLEQTRAIQQLQRCVTDMVAMFMTDPDRPLHEGSIREFLLSLEAVLRNGIKEKFLRAWPEEPYFEFLLQIESVLRDDKKLVADVKALPVASKLQYLGWTRARALLLLALNRNMLHYAFENLIKRRAVVETYYDSHGLLFMYSSATQIVSYLSALNGVKFLLATYPDDRFLDEIDLPPNLKQCAPNDDFEGDIVSPEYDATGYILRSGDAENPDEMKSIEQCSIARNLLASKALKEITIMRGLESSVPIKMLRGNGGSCVALQLCVLPGDIEVSIVLAEDRAGEDHRANYVVKPFVLSATDGWIDLLVVTESVVAGSLELLLDNSNAMMRARQVSYRMRSVSLMEFDTAWESCQGMAQSISWKIATKAGIERCQAYMEGIHFQQLQDVAEQQLRSREASGTHENSNSDPAAEDDSLFGMGASLITKPVSFLVGGFLGLEGDSSPASCAQCLTPFSFFSRQHQCSACQSVVCIPCSRHTAQLNGKGPHVKVCDRCFIKEMDAEKKRRAALSNNSTSGGECAAYAALRDDPSMEKYFKMLSFGVPHSGVAQKMLQDEMPSEKIVVFSVGPSGTTEDNPNAGASKRRGSGGKTDTGSHRGNSFRKVHWKSLETNRATVSIWNRETSRRKTAPIRISPQDFEEVARLFGREAPGSMPDAAGGGKSSGGRKKPLFSALDSRRSNNIAIGLSQFKTVGGADAILKSLKECDFDFLSSDRLSNIYEIAPTGVEAKRYTNFRGSRSRLEPAEKFLVDMCDIPRVTEKIAAMRFVAQFESQHRELRHRIQLITQACYQILRSERLARCFELVLAIGNLLNSGTDIENSGGVTLESLLKLSETKSIDQTMTLLQFIVRLIHDRGESDVLLFIQDLNAISDAKRFSNVICLSQAKVLQNGVGQAQFEIKEEMLEDVKRFEKLEEARKVRHEQDAQSARVRPNGTRVNLGDGELNDAPSANPRAALMEMLRKRNQNGRAVPSTDSPKPSASPQSQPEMSNARGALMAAIQKRQQPGEVARDTPTQDNSTPTSDENPARLALLGAIRDRGSSSLTSSDDVVSISDPKPRAALMDAIKEQVQTVTSDRSTNPNQSSGRGPHPGLPPRANLLSAIRARGPRTEETSQGQPNGRSTQSGTSVSAEHAFKPRVYSVDDNRFITVMRRRIMDIKATMEQLEMEVETMVSVWESTARYLGEDPQSSSSEYVLQLLNRFILDVKIAKTLLSRQGLNFKSLSLTAQVGSIVATKYGPGVVTAVRGDTKLEIAFPWSRESYLSPSSVLSVGAVVRCRTFGIGILRSTHYDRGFCQVRFSYGFGVVRVQDLKPDTSSTGYAFKQQILSGRLIVGDPVTTPFGRGTVRAVQYYSRLASNEATDERDGIVAVNLVTDGDDENRRNVPVAFVHLHQAKTNYQ